MSFDLYTALVDKFYDYMSPVSPDDIANYLDSLVPDLWNKEILPYLTSNCRNITFYRQEECEIEYPLYGDCITKGHSECIIALDKDGNPVVERKGIEITSRYYGAAVGTMLGNTIGTKYTVEVSSTTLEPVYFNLYTRGSREPDTSDQFKFINSSVFIGSFGIFNENGEPVNAAKAGEELQAPLMTRLFVLHDEYTMEVGTAGSCLDGWRLRSLQTVKIEPAGNGIVTYTPVEGGGKVVDTTNAGNGFYEARYETGPELAVNIIDASGKATVTVPEVLSSYDEEWGLSIYRCYNSSTLPEREVTLKTGQVVTFERDTKAPYYYYDGGRRVLNLDIRITNTVYGVDFVPCRNTDTNTCAEEPGEDIKLDPGVVLLNEEGHTTTDTTFRYTIFPPEYNAVSAEIELHEIDETTGESWHGSLVGSSTRGEGGSMLVAGANMFDLNKKYEAQVVLNRGSAAEINSKRVEVPVVSLKVLIDEGTEEVGEIKFSDGSWKNKTYHMELQSNSLAESCESISGTIRVIDKNGKPIESLGAGYYPPEYALSFALSDGSCEVRLEDSGLAKQKFILSNMPKDALYLRLLEFYEFGTPVDLDKIAVLYGGIGNTLEININGAKKEIAVEPVGVIVIGIDGLRQDVLYPDKRDDEDFEDVQDSEDYYVDARDLNGLGQILLGNPEISSSQQYIMLPEVTAVFPSITLASWASIFTGKQPGETGILGNEFFARDLLDRSVPLRFNNPPGIISFSSGAFKGFDKFTAWQMRFDEEFLVPYQADWSEPVEPELTPQNDPMILKPQTVYESINEMQDVRNYFASRGGDPVVVANSHYARGAYWLTWDLEIAKGESALLDKVSWDKLNDYLCGRYTDGIFNGIFDCLGGKRNDVPFSALTVWYLPGLDHEAHGEGMSVYRDYFMETTDGYIGNVVNRLKDLGEFDNKIFIITSDHGHTAMPEFGEVSIEVGSKQITITPDTSCKLKLEGFEDEDVQYAERYNNNLHIWELGNLFTQFPSPIQGIELKVLAPIEIANEVSGATADIDEANIISALNGPMAHIYIKGANWQDNPDLNILKPVVSLLYTVLSDGSNATGELRTTINDYFPNLSTSIDKILVRRELNGLYEVVTGVSEDASRNAVINTEPLDILASTDYINAVERITQMNHSTRSGDIVLIMKDDMSDISQRFSTGVSCKSWHGGLNKSDSYVPFVMAYPGGSKHELDSALNSVCAEIECNGNWILSELIKEIVETQYSGQ